MLDFTSVLYLGMRHGHDALRPWRQMTTGRPAALGSSARATMLARRLAALMGHEAATLGTSTLHLFWDLFDGLAREGVAVQMDAGTYPIGRWGVERAVAKGTPALTFRTHDADALRANLARGPRAMRPVVLTDGVCPLSGRPAPLRRYAELTRAHGGLLVIDDSQGLGLFGRRPRDAAPYGDDGAGTPAWSGIGGSDLVVVSSLAKAFGAPLAVLAGGAASIERFEATSLTRVHCSPPAAAAIGAAENALTINAAEGAERRGGLINLVRLFRRGLRAIGLAAHGGLFPFQTLTHPTGEAAIALHAQLARDGLRTVLHRPTGNARALLTFVFTCLHTRQDIASAVGALARRTRDDPGPDIAPMALLRGVDQ
jgi:8-amino-7-oxononanoate synthase